MCSCGTTGAQIRALPEGHLYYPGATVVTTNDQDADPWNSTDAGVATELMASVPDASIFSWYQGALQGRGWTYRQGGVWSKGADYFFRYSTLTAKSTPSTTYFWVTLDYNPGCGNSVAGKENPPGC